MAVANEMIGRSLSVERLQTIEQGLRGAPPFAFKVGARPQIDVLPEKRIDSRTVGPEPRAYISSKLTVGLPPVRDRVAGNA